MVKKILSVIVGYALWTTIFLGGNFGVQAVRPELYDENGVTTDVPMLCIGLVIAFIASLAGGFVCAKIAGTSKTLCAGILAACLLATGVPVQLGFWDVLPIWYNVTFLILLVPVTMVGAALVKSKASD